ncbi:maleylpyruvate isomerase N-terminal domain-containing protein, partial [Streptomyces alkaliterrae]|uniref:maleylpyruvate isomerase N-terminal domain-containing protein n=1 Tax=Streptomyces alkaliterrae TaxID=2213162 RepID=UPI002B205BA1
MSGVPVDLGALAKDVAVVVAGVREEDLGRGTPCPEYDVRALLGHLHGLCEAFADAAGKRFGAGTEVDPSAALPRLPEGWRESLPVR